MRTRTRRRLIGAFVLVVLAVLTLPVLLDSPPRRLDRDVRLDAPQDGVTAPPMPSAPRAPGAPAAGTALGDVALGAATVAAAATGMAAPAAASAPAGERVSVAASLPMQSVQPARPKVADAADAASRARATAARPAASAASAPRPRALAAPRPEAAARPADRADKATEGKAAARAPARSVEKAGEKTAERAADKAGGKIWLQVGAYSEAATVRGVRQRIDKAGLHSVEQPVTTSAGPRTRVRLGPFASREEADKALTRLRAAGLAATAVAP